MARPKLIRVQEKGQVTLPVEMRERLGLKKGDLVTAVETPEGVLITRQEVLAAKALERLGDILKERGLNLDELIESAREIRGALIEEEYGIKPGAR
jgi:AbrB family looped-hinge helix DNA binding protein